MHINTDEDIDEGPESGLRLTGQIVKSGHTEARARRARKERISGTEGGGVVSAVTGAALS